MKVRVLVSLALSSILLFGGSSLADSGKDKLYLDTLPSIVSVGITFDKSDLQKIHTVGSGVVVGEGGYILTTKHNFSTVGIAGVVVRMADRTIYRATTIILDPEEDLALIKVDATGLIPVKIDLTRPVLPGDSVAVIAYPLIGMIRHSRPSIYSGIIANTHVTLNVPDGATPNLLQLDVFVAPGSSGGALMSEDGYLVGIACMTATEFSSEGGPQHTMYFAYPIEDARRLLTDAGLVQKVNE